MEVRVFTLCYFKFFYKGEDRYGYNYDNLFRREASLEMKVNNSSYQPEKFNHKRTAFKTLFFMLIYHVMSSLIYRLFFSASVNQMVRDEHWGRVRWTMFAFGLVTLVIMALVLSVFYFKNSERKRAYLTATSVEIRGAENVAEGTSRYHKLAFKESLICTLATGILWLIPTLLYTLFLSTSGQGYGYSQAYGVEKFFVSFIGLCEPFQNAFVGLLFGMGILFGFHYLGRLYAHKRWAEERMRR